MSLRRNRLLPVCAAVCAVALTACSGSGGTGGSSEGKGEGGGAGGVVSLAEAKGVLRAYVKVNNAANATQDAEKTATVESGALLSQSQASFQQYPAWTKKEQADSEVPFSYPVADAHFYIPPKGSAEFFMVDTRITGASIDKDRRRLLAFKQVVDETAKSGKTWKAVAVGEITDGLPAVAEDGDGFVTPVAATDKVGSVKAGDLMGLSQDFYVTGGRKAAGTFTDTDSVKAWKKAYANRASFKDDCVDGSYEAGAGGADAAYGVKTEDGGALVLYDFGFVYKNWTKAECPGSELHLDDLPVVTKIYLNGRTTILNLTRTESVIAMAVVPPSGKKVRVTGYQEQLTYAQ
ncbi:hypothetical protein ABZY09_08640 [Streptomyces sp. NPDC002928]|uniref:hypothetical protein n=1 Tax=Streptomyces sp. NPDC002928 TaxID=3154440 RepID=UPI0033BAEAEE